MLGLSVNLNCAGVEELDTLRGVGPVLASRIAEARPFAQWAELRSVKGIGPKKLESLHARGRLGPCP
jgi:competence protein ComEA